MRRLFGVLLAGAMLILPAFAQSASAQQAHGCRTSAMGTTGAEMGCTDPGTYQYRVYITCVVAGTSTTYTVYGPWVGSPQASDANCNGSDHLLSTGSTGVHSQIIN